MTLFTYKNDPWFTVSINYILGPEFFPILVFHVKLKFCPSDFKDQISDILSVALQCVDSLFEICRKVLILFPTTVHYNRRTFFTMPTELLPIVRLFSIAHCI